MLRQAQRQFALAAVLVGVTTALLSVFGGRLVPIDVVLTYYGLALIAVLLRRPGEAAAIALLAPIGVVIVVVVVAAPRIPVTNGEVAARLFFLGAFGIASVLTAVRLRYAQRELRDANEKLQQRIEVQTVELEERSVGLGAETKQRQEIEELLHEREQDFRLLVEQMNDGFGILDEQGRLIYANDRGIEMLGYPRDEAYGRSALDFVADEDKAAFLEQMQSRRQGEAARYELVVRQKDGEKVTLIVSAQPLMGADGTFRSTSAVLTDITERRQVEDALRESEERYRSLVERMNDGLGVLDENAVITYANRRLCDMLGYEPGALTGLDATEIIHEDSRATFREKMAERAKGRGGSYELDLVTKHGGRISVIVSAQPLFDASGEARGSFAVMTDITDRKQAEEALQESEERYRDIFEAAFEGIVVHDNGVILDANPAFEKMAGQPLADLVGKYLPDLAGKQRREALEERLSSSPGEPYEAAGEKASGESVVVEAVTREHTYRGRPVRVTTVRDITARKRAEEALQRARDELEGKVERRMVQGNRYGLTFREFTVLHHLATGKADKEIATELVISPLTVHKHVANILAKMDASSRTEAGVRALREGLLD